MVTAFRNGWKLYCSEALGLATFMISACFFAAMLEGDTAWHKALPDPMMRLVLTGILMGSTALLIFYSPFTAPSGSQINPAVTLTFFRLGRMKAWDAVFYILFQILGGTLAVYAMAAVMGSSLTMKPVNYAATVPVKGAGYAFLIEFVIAFVMMTMVLFTAAHQRLQKYTRLFSGCFVCLYVIVAGPVSGFGMNPARSLASAIPSHTWTAFWIYALVPVASMLLAAEVYLRWQRYQMLQPLNRFVPHQEHKSFMPRVLKSNKAQILNEEA
jgi:aquaporin Z